MVPDPYSVILRELFRTAVLNVIEKDVQEAVMWGGLAERGGSGGKGGGKKGVSKLWLAYIGETVFNLFESMSSLVGTMAINVMQPLSGLLQRYEDCCNTAAS